MSFVDKFPSFAGKSFSQNDSNFSQCCSVRIVQCDYSMVPPVSNWDIVYSDFNSQQTFQVPVIRIFGPESKTGAKTCAHIHGVLPYFYVSMNQNTTPNEEFVRAFAESCERALRSSAKTQQRKTIKGAFIYSVEVVAGIPVYGYYATEQEFLKIFMYNPSHVGWLADLLSRGVVMGVVFQPYESHIPFVMQFLVDFNLFGMNLVHLSHVKRRPESSNDNNSSKIENEDVLERITVCEIEFDTLACCILNKSESSDPVGSQKRLANPGLRSIWKDEFDRQKMFSKSKNVDIANPTSPERKNIQSYEGESKQLEDIFANLWQYDVSTNTLASTSPKLDTSSNRPLKTPNKVDFEAGRVKASSTPFVDGNLRGAPEELKTPCGNKSVSFSLPLVNENESGNQIENDVCKSGARNEFFGSQLSGSNLSILSLLQNVTQASPRDSLINRSGLLLHQFPDETQNVEDAFEYFDRNDDITRSELAVLEEALDEMENHTLSQIVTFDYFENKEVGPEEDDDLRVNLSQFDGKNEVVVAGGVVCSELRENRINYHLPVTMRPCVVLLERLRLSGDNAMDGERLRGIELEPNFRKRKSSCLNLDKFEFATPVKKVNRKDKLSVNLPKFEVSSLKKLTPIVQIEELCSVDKGSGKGSEREGKQRFFDDNVVISDSSPEVESNYSEYQQAQSIFAAYTKSTVPAVNQPSLPIHQKFKSFNTSSERHLPPGESNRIDCVPDETQISLVSIEPSVVEFDHLDSQTSAVQEEDEKESEISRSSIATTISVGRDGINSPSRDNSEAIPEPSPPASSMPRTDFPQPVDKLSSQALDDNSIEVLDLDDSFDASAYELRYQMFNQDISASTSGVPKDLIRMSPELFSSPETNDITKISFANLPPTRSYVMKRLTEDSLFEVDYTVDNRLIRDVEGFHSRSNPQETLKVSRLILTPALLPPKIDKTKVTKALNGYDKITEVDLDTSREDTHVSSKSFRPSSPSMFYSFMPPVVEENFGDGRNGNANDSWKLDLENGQTPFATRHSTSGISMYKGNDMSFNSVKDAGIEQSSQSHRCQHLTIMSLELHVATRGNLLPNPLFDPIAALFYSILDDGEKNDNKVVSGVLITAPESESIRNRIIRLCSQRDLELKFCDSEIETVIEFSHFVHNIDPDIVIGYEVQKLSWGYLLKRGTTLGIDMVASVFSRVPKTNESHFDGERDVYGADEMSEINLTGRIVLNTWRIIKSELSIRSYSFQNVYLQVLKRRIPRFSFKSLTSWFNPFESYQTGKEIYKALDHLMMQSEGSILILVKLDLITRTSEMSRLFGILFFEVLTRGTQFRVESMLIRSAKTRNFIVASPSIQQRAKMRAPEHIPLVLEPESGFYADPVLVLDFQSLYPSMMIAYNYCYSTCLGRVEHLKDETNSIFQLGALSYFVPAESVKKLIKKKKVHVAPNGVAYVDASVRKGLICQLVEDILNTRIMVKRFMKNYKHDAVLYKMLDARQLGLKLIANVTYGYTGASFSGRMPCVEIADSIVRKARETLERSIEVVHSTARWNAQVIYGDTDSMFVRLPGASKETAFKVGQEIGDVITQMNPKPVKLKFEKVYFPCVLVTKKRYVGYSYESLDQTEPLFDAKGIETVRRDNCPLVGKIMEKTLRVLFETKDLSVVKDYVQRQLVKISHGRVPMTDFIFAKEFRGRDRYKPGAYIAALKIADKQLALDPMAEPLRGDRVPYCIVYDAPKLPLYKLIRSPSEVVKNPLLRLNSLYYITKQVLPPLDRIFSLIDQTNVFNWFKQLPVYSNQMSIPSGSSILTSGKTSSLAMFVSTSTCVSCFRRPCNVRSQVCDVCFEKPQQLLWKLSTDLRQKQKTQRDLRSICLNCSGHTAYVNDCDNFDCPVFNKLLQLCQVLPQQSETLTSVEDRLSSITF